MVGAGRCWFIRNGAWVPATWRKDGPATEISYRSYSGYRLAAAPGPIWVQVIPEISRPTFRSGPGLGKKDR